MAKGLKVQAKKYLFFDYATLLRCSVVFDLVKIVILKSTLLDGHDAFNHVLDHLQSAHVVIVCQSHLLTHVVKQSHLDQHHNEQYDKNNQHLHPISEYSDKYKCQNIDEGSCI